jgi:hypothetical protein
MQNHHSLLYREEEREMFPTLKVRASSCPFYLNALFVPLELRDLSPFSSLISHLIFTAQSGEKYA